MKLFNFVWEMAFECNHLDILVPFLMPLYRRVINTGIWYYAKTVATFAVIISAVVLLSTSLWLLYSCMHVTSVCIFVVVQHNELCAGAVWIRGQMNITGGTIYLQTVCWLPILHSSRTNGASHISVANGIAPNYFILWSKWVQKTFIAIKQDSTPLQ